MLKRMWKHELCLKCLTIMAPAILAQALLLGSLNPTLRKKTHPPTPRSGVIAAKPPDEAPDEFKEDVAACKLPLAGDPGQPRQLWAHRDTSRWKTWRIAGTPQRRRGRMAPGTSMSRPRAMRLLQAVLVRGGSQGDHPGQAGPTKAPLEVLCDRRQLEDAYVAIHGTPKPRLEFQGSDGYLKKQWRLIAKGELGYIPAKHIVSALPEEGERPSSTHKKITVDGWDREDEEEVRSHPASRRQLERLHQIFRTTLLMCTAALPQFGNLKVTKAELDDWYDWFYGEDIAGRRPPPSDTTLLFAERNAWRKIHEMVHQGTTLSDALKNIRGDFLFCQREVYERLNRAPEKGKNKGKAPKVWQTQWEKPKKGGEGACKPKGKGGKGKSPNSPSVPWPDHWAFKNPKRGRTAEIITSTTSARDRAAVPTTARSGRMGGCVMPPHRSMRHRHALTFPSDRRPLRVL